VNGHKIIKVISADDDSLNSIHFAVIHKEYKLEQSFLLLFLFNAIDVTFPWAGLLQEHQLATRMELLSLVPRMENDVSCRQYDEDLAVECLNEILFAYLHGLFELGMLGIARGGRCSPRSVVLGNPTRNSRLHGILDLTLIDSIINCINFLHYFKV